MGDLQTYYYLGLISLVLLSLGVLLVFFIFWRLRRWARQAHGHTPLLFWLIGSAVTVALLFFVLGTVGVLYGFIRYGAS